MSTRLNMPMKLKSSDCWDRMLPSFSVRTTMSGHMVVAIGQGNRFDSWPMSKVVSSNVTSGGMVLSLLKSEFSATMGLLSNGVTAAIIGITLLFTLAQRDHF